VPGPRDPELETPIPANRPGTDGARSGPATVVWRSGHAADFAAWAIVGTNGYPNNWGLSTANAPDLGDQATTSSTRPRAPKRCRGSEAPVTTFRPTRPPEQRLVRLGVVLDCDGGVAHVRQVATMCERASIDVVWLARGSPGDGLNALDVWAALEAAASTTEQVRLGVMLDPAAAPGPVSDRLGALDAPLRGRLEIGLRSTRPDPAGGSIVGEPTTLVAVETTAVTIRPLVARVSLEAAHPAMVSAALALADDIVLPPMRLAEACALLAEIRQAAGQAARPAATLGIAIEAPVSIGRTAAEARARAEAEPRFQGPHHPTEFGIFGRLEECQDRVIELAHLGVTDLRCVPPASPDVHDVIAQLTAMVAGSTAILRPHAERSKAPDPPPGWGGRRR
jgi:alkanesulfonate monooxygenase SsuD/methylene tetrahydromethanopterin reductase-like flavin-dependent oxidoreductase (luciferase family)